MASPSTIRVLLLVLASLSMVACESHQDFVGIFTDPRAAGQNLSEASDLYVVAHPDDDLLFMNPDVSGSIDSGRGVVTVFLTAGDDGRDSQYWQQREQGVRAAYAAMAGAANDWHRAQLVVGDKAVWMDTLAGNNRVHLVFFRLPDGHIHGGGSHRYRFASLMHLWKGDRQDITSVDGVNQYTADSLEAALAELMQHEGASFLGVLNARLAEDGATGPRRDHSDHAYSALLALEATKRVAEPIEIRLYRGYDIQNDPPNLSPQEEADKSATFLEYALRDPAICPDVLACKPNAHYRAWLGREYPSAP